MVLDLYMYTQDANLLRRYFPIVSETLDFFSQHYLNRTQDGKIQFWPTQVLETYWCDYPPTPTNCPTNDAPTVAAMISLTQRTLSLPSTFLTPDQQQRWTKFAACRLLLDVTLLRTCPQAHCPALPTLIQALILPPHVNALACKSATIPPNLGGQLYPHARSNVSASDAQQRDA